MTASSTPRTPTAAASAPAADRDIAMSTVQCGDTRWQIRTDAQHELLTAAGLRRGEWEGRQLLTVIKTGPHREVVRVETAAGNFFVKHYKIAGLKPLLQNLIRPAKAILEQRMAARIRRRGVPTFETVAWGASRRGGLVWDNYLVTREIPGTEPLDAFLRERFLPAPSPDSGRLRRELADELGRFTARLHDAGVVHRDFHAGNILIRSVEGEPLRLWLIDLHCAHTQTALALPAAQRNLAMLHQFFATRTSRSDRYRFFRAYWAERGLTGSLSAAARGTQQRCDARAQRHWRRKDRKWRQGTRHLRKLRCGRHRGRGLTVLGRELLNDICANPDRLFEFATAWFKQSEKRRVAAIRVPEILQGRELFWKSVRLHGALPRLSQFLGRSSVRRAWENGHALLRRDIPTPQPLLFVEASDGDGVWQYLLTESIPDSTTLYHWSRQELPSLPPPQRRRSVRQLAEALARRLHWMHQCGFEHRDLKSKNILVSKRAGDDGTWFLDLEAVRRWPRVPRERVIQNLSRLNVSSLSMSELQLSDRLRFLKTYLGSEFSREWKSTWQKIEVRTRRKIDRNRKNGRPLS